MPASSLRGGSLSADKCQPEGTRSLGVPGQGVARLHGSVAGRRPIQALNPHSLVPPQASEGYLAWGGEGQSWL